MPNGKTHDKLTVATAAASVPAWWVAVPLHDAQNTASLAAALAAYVFSGFWLSDDLDTHSISYKRWGAFRFLWWPYQKLVPHRSWISHGIGVGPLVRVAYFLLMLWAIVRGAAWCMIEAGVAINRDALLMGAWQHTWAWTRTHPSWALWAVVGLVLGGVTHSLADIVVSWCKKIW